MGNCAGNPSGLAAEDRKRMLKHNEAVELALMQDAEQEQSIVKILLLGTGNSGKSTILKQFKILHSDQGLGKASDHKLTVSMNIIRGITVVAQGVADLEEVTISLSPRNAKIISLLRSYPALSVWSELEFEGKPEQIAMLCKEVWEDPAMAETIKYEGKLSMLEVPIAYFMSHIDRIAAADYEPSTDDILQARTRTSGVVKIEFLIDKTQCRMLDVGGQRNERKKWISHFDNVTAIMFLVSLSEYDKFLLEDSTVNRMHDALEVFRDIVECPYFEETNIILFLNKKDLFEEKIKHVDLRVCFPDYTGANDYDEAVQFVETKFVEIFKAAKEQQAVDSMTSDIYPFQTMATNTKNVETVFQLSKHCVFKENLRSTGLI
ncbi:Guanine nucleotide-binding protein subunit alpha [Hondaea fermentalgiana]|uniref:Guanine nucleotide-binding protein subunit alpha n=1 Tax=Hondaea fermentalgiana TaxID=2315210 RepID=A0A2R5GGE9_9STRA|nr:Guanine nucleotide-binding protein subunit alpha [Hondaea fermentalgiana]|eukprot:GBG29950.1 Guanine nucleotide-binding protein subunit alpha [Hondaea fermentalgiana]